MSVGMRGLYYKIADFIDLLHKTKQLIDVYGLNLFLDNDNI